MIPECRLFCRKLGLPEENAIYLASRRDPDQTPEAHLRSDGLDLCYLGAINNVVNVDAIAGLTAQLARLKPVTVHVIGDGEKCPQLLQALRDAGAEVDWLGVVFDESRKHEVMSRCHFGFNLMKPDVCVGLTMKSVDYFRHDLPILNNIPADTAELVDREQVGLNVGEDTAARVAAMTVGGWRLILSDDGEDTAPILQEYADKYPDKITHYRSGRRFGSAQKHFMHLLEQFGGQADYIMFSDQDDVWHPDKVRLTLRLMSRRRRTRPCRCWSTRTCGWWTASCMRWTPLSSIIPAWTAIVWRWSSCWCRMWSPAAP